MTRFRLPLLAVVVTALLISVPAVRLTARSAPVTATFDWSVPDRLGPDGMFGVAVPFSESDATLRVLNPEGSYGGVAPAGWPAFFTACTSQGGSRYVWSVNGTLAADSQTCGPTRIVFPREGMYLVELKVVDLFGGEASTAQNVNIQDWLIFGLGDSYASGEGNPNVPINPADLALADNDRLVAEAEADRFEDAQAQVAAAQVAVNAAIADRNAAVANYNALVAASAAYAQAALELANAQNALNAATAALAKATANVVAATAKVAFECAQLWDPAGCNSAKTALTKAKQAEASAAATRSAAVSRRDAAAVEAARLALTVPVEGFEYVIGVAAAQLDVLAARVASAQAALSAALQFVASQLAIMNSAKAAFELKASGLATWQDTRLADNGGMPVRFSQCHQSKYSGQAQAALQIERQDPKTSVTFIHLACSGARILADITDPDKGGMLTSYVGLTPNPVGTTNREPQLVVAKRLSAGREVDAFLTSIGGNDIGFGDLIKGCIAKEPCYAPIGQQLTDGVIDSSCAPTSLGPFVVSLVPTLLCTTWIESAREEMASRSLAAELDQKMAALPGKYVAMQNKITESWPNLPASRVMITQYPRITRDGNGNICGFDIDPLHSPPGITSSEFLWTEQAAGDRLNGVIANQAATLGWTVITGVDQDFTPHGYCAEDTWVVRLESFLNQGTKSGIAHPTATGQMAYAARIVTALHRAFYPQSTETTIGPARVDAR